MFKKHLHNFVLSIWSKKSLWHVLFYPLSFLFYLIYSIRKYILIRFRPPVPCPIIVVGNLTVGGTGKTTLVIELANHFISRGFKVGIVSRGYGRKHPKETLLVNHDIDPRFTGDEALLIWKKTKSPICLGPNRNKSVQILSKLGVNLIISDDGLQDYAFSRSLEICLFPDEKNMKNGLLLPLGPFRELPSRSETCDLVIGSKSGFCPSEAHYMTYEIQAIESLDSQYNFDITNWPHEKKIIAFCAIGNPCKFFQMLRDFGFEVVENALPDHAFFSAFDFESLSPSRPIFVTEKDAVKIDFKVKKSIWVVKIRPKFSHDICQIVENQINVPDTESSLQTCE